MKYKRKKFHVSPVEISLQRKSMHVSILDAHSKSMSLDSVKNMNVINIEKRNKKGVYVIVILLEDVLQYVKMIKSHAMNALRKLVLLKQSSIRSERK